MNKVILMGRLTKEPESRQTQAGKKYVRFALAVKRRFAKEGQQQADFVNCIAWDKTAEFIAKYFHKGSMLAVSGSIQTGSYDKDGRTYYTTDVLVGEAYFTGEKKDAQQNAEPSWDDFEPEDMSGEPDLLF